MVAVGHVLHTFVGNDHAGVCFWGVAFTEHSVRFWTDGDLVSLIDKLEQPTLANAMRDIELHVSSGQLVLKQGVLRIELSFHQGNLMCIGPVRTQATLGERLLAAGIISQQALQETMQVLGNGTPSEARIARTLVELNHVSREALRIWAVARAAEVIQPLLSWSQYELSFDENIPLPSDRLFVKIAPSSLLTTQEQVVQPKSLTPSVPSRISLPPIARNGNADSVPSLQGERTTPSLPSMQVVQPAVSAPNVHNIHVDATNVPRVDIAKVPTLMDSSQFFPDNVPVTPLLRSTDPLMAAVKSAGSSKIPSFTPPSSVTGEKQLPFPAPLATQETPDHDSFNEQDVPSTNFPKLLDEQDVPFSGFLKLVDEQEIAASSFPKLVDEQNAPSATFSLLFDEQEEQAVVKPKLLLSVASMRIDTSFMSGDMVLIPTDMEQLAAQELDIQITPPQWQLFIRADGQTSLSKMCIDLRVYREQVYQIAGELMMLGLVQVIPTQVPEAMPQAQEFYPVSVYNAPMPLNGMLPSTPPLGTPNSDVQSSFGAVPSFDVQSHGGNRGNGTAFGPHGAWNASSMPLQSSPNNGPMMAMPGNYMPVGGRK